jgi:hypothetical protein
MTSHPPSVPRTFRALCCWAFERRDGRWLAIWRTMVDLKEERMPGGVEE